LLNPLKSEFGAKYKTKYFNVETDKFVESEFQIFETKSILIFDGIFLHRKELIDYWDFSIFLKVSRQETLKRIFKRDKKGSTDIKASSNKRYVEGQKIYFEKEKPMQKATIIIDNENFDKPKIIFAS